MKTKTTFDSIFEPPLLQEMHQFGEIKIFKEGEIMMDYGKYIRYDAADLNRYHQSIAHG